MAGLIASKINANGQVPFAHTDGVPSIWRATPGLVVTPEPATVSVVIVGGFGLGGGDGGQEPLFLVRKRVRLEPQQPLEDDPVVGQSG